MGNHVVGYLRWRDFLDEVKALHPETIRVQAYHRMEGKPPLVMVRFYVEASFVSPVSPQGEIHVARLPLGSVLDLEIRNHPEVQKKFAALASEAEQILRNALALCGTNIRPGVYAETHRVKVLTAPDGLWRLEPDGDSYRLIPEPQEEPAQ